MIDEDWRAKFISIMMFVNIALIACNIIWFKNDIISGITIGIAISYLLETIIETIIIGEEIKRLDKEIKEFIDKELK